MLAATKCGGSPSAPLRPCWSVLRAGKRPRETRSHPSPSLSRSPSPSSCLRLPRRRPRLLLRRRCFLRQSRSSSRRRRRRRLISRDRPLRPRRPPSRKHPGATRTRAKMAASAKCLPMAEAARAQRATRGSPAGTCPRRRRRRRRRQGVCWTSCPTTLTRCTPRWKRWISSTPTSGARRTGSTLSPAPPTAPPDLSQG